MSISLPFDFNFTNGACCYYPVDINFLKNSPSHQHQANIKFLLVIDHDVLLKHVDGYKSTYFYFIFYSRVNNQLGPSTFFPPDLLARMNAAFSEHLGITVKVAEKNLIDDMIDSLPEDYDNSCYFL